MELEDFSDTDLQALYKEAEDADTRKLQDMYTFNLTGHKRFKIVIQLYGTEYTSKSADRKSTKWALENMHESNLDNLGQFMFTEPGVAAVSYLWGKTQAGEWEKIKSKRELELDAAFICMDCGADTDEIDEYYSVTEQVWESATQTQGDGKGMLCVGCLETRIGRQLTPADFPDAPVNDVDWGHKSERLVERIRG